MGRISQRVGLFMFSLLIGFDRRGTLSVPGSGSISIQYSLTVYGIVPFIVKEKAKAKVRGKTPIRASKYGNF